MGERNVLVTVQVTNMDPGSRRLYRILRKDIGLSRDEACFALLGFSDEIARMINVGSTLHQAIVDLLELSDDDYD